MLVKNTFIDVKADGEGLFGTGYFSAPERLERAFDKNSDSVVRRDQALEQSEDSFYMGEIFCNTSVQTDGVVVKSAAIDSTEVTSLVCAGDVEEQRFDVMRDASNLEDEGPSFSGNEEEKEDVAVDEKATGAAEQLNLLTAAEDVSVDEKAVVATQQPMDPPGIVNYSGGGSVEWQNPRGS